MNNPGAMAGRRVLSLSLPAATHDTLREVARRERRTMAAVMHGLFCEHVQVAHPDLIGKVQVPPVVMS